MAVCSEPFGFMKRAIAFPAGRIGLFEAGRVIGRCSTIESDSDVRPIESLEQIPSTLRPELYALLLKANQAHGPERAEVAVEEINLFSRLVFEDQNRWNSSMLPSTPVHRPMEPGNDGVIGPIGRFIEDLPLLDHQSLRGAEPNEARKKHCPAFFKIELDTATGVLNHIFLDDNLNPVQAHLVECEAGTGVLTAEQIATAIRVMDNHVERFDNYFNEDLAIYLWQTILFNHTHPDTPYGPEDYDYAVFTADDFIRPRRIRDVYKTLEGADEDVTQIIETSPKAEFFVPSL
ncbi:hypothetical protein BJ166DRAFT_500222 [Pestalotiopsis sp. NC0098]|nr:hypothetical protein BJ166DRAFT_500222 [Pestalotiopsis sp. NC0098]